ncbi:hypothetical protein A1F94_001920 [Pyrenophora tritici-repentis]|nr:hypothetical protein A1F94_001920 [Pyrenophora tritici-repentis]PZD38118.1 hypothetical protein A1F97_06997 [Pyrenophora tritici-repentis]
MRLAYLPHTAFLIAFTQILVYRVAANDPRARWREAYPSWESYTPPTGNSTQWLMLTGVNSSVTSATMTNFTTAVKDMTSFASSTTLQNSPTCSNSSSKYDNIEYSTSTGYVEKGTSYVSVSVSSSHFPSKQEAGGYDTKALRKQLIDQVAETYKLATEDAKNCYWFDRRSTKLV